MAGEVENSILCKLFLMWNDVTKGRKNRRCRFARLPSNNDYIYISCISPLANSLQLSSELVAAWHLSRSKAQTSMLYKRKSNIPEFTPNMS
jgi:hypothetical protein